jgi:hypothetical protein
MDYEEEGSEVEGIDDSLQSDVVDTVEDNNYV